MKGEKLYHHIYAWGNDRHPVFKDVQHYKRYLDYLRLYCRMYKIETIAYALMEWHLHLFIYDIAGRISKFMKNLHGEYAKYFNKHARRVGHVFGERFNNKIVQPNNYGLWLSRYIHRQPVEAGIVSDPKEYAWTSYRAYIGLEPLGFIKPDVILEQFGRGKDGCNSYQAFVLGTDEGPVEWQATQSAVIGDANFLERHDNPIDEEKEELGDKELLKLLSRQLGVKPVSILKPRGHAMRRLRHRAFVISAEEYGISATRLARMFDVSAMAVAKVLKKHFTWD
jgi:REP element-mobilizing transposase RayT